MPAEGRRSGPLDAVDAPGTLAAEPARLSDRGKARSSVRNPWSRHARWRLSMIRKILFAATALASAAALPMMAQAQSGKDSVVVGMALEPPGLDATAGAAAAIGEITDYNIYE